MTSKARAGPSMLTLAPDGTGWLLPCDVAVIHLAIDWKVSQGKNREVERQKKTWQRPTLPHTKCSTIGEEAFHGRVRFTVVFGMGTCGSRLSMATRKAIVCDACVQCTDGSVSELKQQYGQASRLISTGRLNTSPCLYLRPIEQMVCLFPSGPSRGRGCLILRRASRLDAFSGYPFRTWLPGSCRWRDNRYTRGPSTSVLSY